jgi:GT2 family glycosyltransferase
VCQTEEIWIRNGLRVNPMKKHRKHSGYIFERCLERCIISPSAVLMEREFFEKLGGFDPEFPVCEDYDLWLRASLESPVETLSAPLVVKRGGHQDQLSKKYQAMDRFRVKAMEKILAAAILTDPQREALLKELKKKLGVLAGGFMKRYPEQFNPYARKLSDYFEASHG